MERKSYIVQIKYDGRNYSGWRRQSHDQNTIQQVMEETLRKMTNTKVNLHAASWTDAGVHADCQIAVMVLRQNIDKYDFMAKANSLFPEDIRILDINPAPPGFDPIGGNQGKHYRYTIWNGQSGPPDTMTCWHIAKPLSIEKMQIAADMLVGTHDFRGIKLAKDRRKDCVRTIFACQITRENSTIFIDIKGDNFIYMMIRTLASALVEIGTEQKAPESISKLLSAKDNRFAPVPAPGSGLCLLKIYFDEI